MSEKPQAPVWHTTKCTVLESTRRVVIKGIKFNI